MKTFLQGNVIKSAYGSIEIVTKVRDKDYIECIPIDSTNVTIGHAREDKTYNRTCHCNDNPECECKGTGEYKQTILGFEKAEFLGSNIKEYIVNNVIRGIFAK